MATVDVLVPGHVDEETRGDIVHPTISLVLADGVVMVVDPGILSGQDLLIDALAARGLTPAEVTHVFVTHHHIDHTRNIGMFPAATVIDTDSTYAGNLWAEHSGDGFALTPEITVIQTPGHSAECASLVVQTSEGIVVLTHAWWFADMTPAEDPLAVDQGQLEKSRARILEIADIVIPGHGAPFKPNQTTSGSRDGLAREP
jgi:glyoxylase-like metal-dependent hydrolase (beta-lactamase superfamily II)